MRDRQVFRVPCFATGNYCEDAGHLSEGRWRNIEDRCPIHTQNALRMDVPGRVLTLLAGMEIITRIKRGMSRENASVKVSLFTR